MTLNDLPIVHIDRDEVYIGGVRLPDYIAETLVIKPGGATDVNRLTVTFIVGHIRVDDPTLPPAARQPTQQEGNTE